MLHLYVFFSFSIILMNVFVPYFEDWTAPTPFGFVKEKKQKKAKTEKETSFDVEKAQEMAKEHRKNFSTKKTKKKGRGA